MMREVPPRGLGSSGVEVMFFLFRCVFWLGLVFYHLPWADGARPADQARDIVAEIGAATTRMAVEQARAACVSTPRACLETATGAMGAASRSSLTRDDAQPTWRDPGERHARADLRGARVR